MRSSAGNLVSTSKVQSSAISTCSSRRGRSASRRGRSSRRRGRARRSRPRSSTPASAAPRSRRARAARSTSGESPRRGPPGSTARISSSRPTSSRDARLGLVRRAVGRVAEVERASTRAGITFVGDPAVDLRHAQHLAEEETVDVDVARLELEHVAEPLERELRPRSRRATAAPNARMRPSKTTRALRLPRQPSWSVLSVGSRQITSAASSTTGVASKTPGSGLLRAELLAREEEQAQVVGELGLGRPARELDHHGEPALHVGRAEPVDRAVLDPAREVPLRGNGVRVAGEQHERPARALRVERATRRRRRRARAGRAP